MPLGRARGRGGDRSISYWPGFVDALSTLLLVFTFLLAVFVLAQFFLSREVSGKDEVLTRLNRQLQQLTELLSLEKGAKTSAEGQVASLTATLDLMRSENEKLKGAAEGAGAAAQRAGALQGQIDSEKQLAARALAQVEQLNQQIAALRKQLQALEEALNASEAKDKDAQARISDLGNRLNVALAQRVQELNRYRSDFFGRLRQVLGARPDIRIVGDRFVFQSELFFETGASDLSVAGSAELDKIAAALQDLEREIPPEIPWIARIDGHTDKRPFQSGSARSNWELSANRAISVVRYLVSKGVSPQRLAATGFGEFQPIDLGESPEALARNRRLELKVTER
ncbi:MAG TPA: peptidoglycan -binding protein [Beijerinckiaceae bacterium]|nr:peptidoglycan -binding protein [Beijerinckiaceae bacterium]